MALAQIAQMFYEPSKAFESLKEKPRAWVPLLIMMACTLGIMVWYFQTVDFAWLKEHSMPPDFPADKREAAAKVMNPQTMMYIGLASAVVIMPLFLAIIAACFLLFSRLAGMDLKYGQSFSLAVWASVTSLIGLPLMALQIATGKGQLLFQELNMLSLNFLLVHAAPFTPWAGFADGIGIPLLWQIFLASVGLKVWTGKSMAVSASVAAAPFVIWYGLWAAKIAFLG